MMIMPSNNVGPIAKKLYKNYPDKTALMMNHTRWWNPEHQYALDNGAFKKFEEKLFFDVLEKTKRCHPPLFIVCPDVVGCHDRTFALWYYYYPKLKRYGYPIAFVAQDGCEPELVPDAADWIFVGGSPETAWKSINIHKYIGDRPVHVGRVNSIGFVEYCESIGVASIDGTGWFRARDKKFYDLMEWFEGNKQLQLWT